MVLTNHSLEDKHIDDFALPYKTNRFHVALGLSSNTKCRSQKTKIYGKSISDLCVPFFVLTTFLHILLSFTEQRHNNMEYICQTLLCKKQNKTKQNKKKSLFQFSLLIFSCFSTHSCLIFSLSNLSISCLKRIPKIYLLITQCSVHL